ncbi:2-nitropropane dioxygenase [Amanita rubescens]|nr:2-nitropropane dioxygenase [Amanita rubescens]
MSSIDTGITRLLGIKSPVICAPMAGVSGGALAAQVYLGGGFGFLAAGYDTPDKFRDEISIARSQLNCGASERLPIGIGFLAWQLEKAPPKAHEMVTIALDNKVQAIWLAFGQDLGQHILFIREYESKLKRDWKVLIFIQTSSPEEAKTATTKWEADVIVAQGNEAGGHGYTKSLPLLTLLPTILAAVHSDRSLVLAAGGLATGAQVAAVLALGASGAVLGTRFLLTPESSYTDAQKRALADANSSSTVRTMAFDYARNTLGWPDGVDGRGLRNRTVDEFEGGESLDVIRRKFEEGIREDDPGRMLVWAGTGVSLMKEIKSAKTIVQELHEECSNRLRAIATSCI